MTKLGTWFSDKNIKTIHYISELYTLNKEANLLEKRCVAVRYRLTTSKLDILLHQLAARWTCGNIQRWSRVKRTAKYSVVPVRL